MIKPTGMGTDELELAVRMRYDIRTHTVIPNAYWGLGFSHEIDVLVVRKTGYCLEYEIKRTFSDFKKDGDKRKWILHKKMDGSAPISNRIKEFWYVFPANLWFKREGDIRSLLPDFAGVLVVFHQGSGKIPRSEIKRNPKPNRNAKPLAIADINNANRLGMIRFWDLKMKTLITNTNGN